MALFERLLSPNSDKIADQLKVNPDSKRYVFILAGVECHLIQSI